MEKRTTVELKSCRNYIKRMSCFQSQWCHIVVRAFSEFVDKVFYLFNFVSSFSYNQQAPLSAFNLLADSKKNTPKLNANKNLSANSLNVCHYFIAP